MKNTLLTLLLAMVPALSFAEVLYLEKDKKPVDQFLISNSLRDAELEISNQLGDQHVDISCEGSISYKKKGLLRFRHSGSSVSFDLKDKKSVKLTIPVETKSCVLKIAGQTIQLVNDETAYPFLAKYNHTVESCNYQYDSRLISRMERLFLTGEFPMMTCAHPAGQIDILSDSEDGLLVKMEALLGYKPSVSFIRNQNPYADLDFSQAPELDAIFVSTLLYRHDFTGTVIARLLKHHAARGTLINIMGTGYMHEDKDKALLRELSQLGGNVRVQEYKYKDPDSSLVKPLMNYVDNLLRDMHIKMFVTLSEKNPANNVLIMGGRNIHDGFVFSEKPDFSKYPELDQAPEGAYAYWNDLEIKITSPELARSVYTHLLKFWNRDLIGAVTPDISLPRKDAKTISGMDVLNSKTTMMRHFMSLPFNDDHALEDLYVSLIDKAETSIKLSSPYLRPTKAIMKAIERAIARKIDITIQTRIDLKGDTQAWLYEETNKAAINSLYDKIKLYEWKENSILHTKMILIDGKFAFFGSVNLSRRSFIQDVENGFLIHDQNFVQRLDAVFQGYNARSHQIDQKQKRKFWAGLVVSIFQNQF